MVDVFLTVDVEVWCDGWQDLKGNFSQAFRRYVYGPTAKGAFGLPYQIEMLNDHGLQAVFFVESLFAARFGIDPLAEIVGLLADGRQEVQLHLHPEWTQEALQPIVEPYDGRRPGMGQFSLSDQQLLIACAKEYLHRAGVDKIAAFRAGSFAFNTDTLTALDFNGIPIDCSYNASTSGPASGLRPGELLVQPTQAGPLWEYPMTVFEDGLGKLRHAQVTACAYGELETVLWRAAEERHRAVVILWHNFEMLNEAKNRADSIVCRRFERLCRFLDRHRDAFRVQGFDGLRPYAVPEQPAPVSSGVYPTAVRLAEQALRRGFA